MNSNIAEKSIKNKLYDKFKTSFFFWGGEQKYYIKEKCIKYFLKFSFKFINIFKLALKFLHVSLP